MQRFDGRSWSVNSESLGLPGEDLARGLPMALLFVYGEMYPGEGLQTLEMTVSEFMQPPAGPGIIYSPYYCIPEKKTAGRYWHEFINTDKSVLEIVEALPETVLSRTRYLSDYYGWANINAVYTQINDDTAAGLRKLAAEAGIDPGGGREYIAGAVAAYISSAGKYTLSPYVIPEGEDFALYFLEKSKQGYCIHFATAAALMLRALDVPARVACGFVVDVPPGGEGQAVSVTDQNAHAWVEVYYDYIGWIPLEVTPPAPRGADTGGYYIANTDRAPYPDFEDESDMIPDWMLEQLMADRPNIRSGGTEGQETQQARPGMAVLRVFIPAATFLILAAAALLLRRKLARGRREKRFMNDDTNLAVVYAWRYIVRLTRQKPPQNEYEAMALKARFSQHCISEEERGRMLAYSAALTKEIYGHVSAFRRLWLKWGLAVGNVKC